MPKIVIRMDYTGALPIPKHWDGREIYQNHDPQELALMKEHQEILVLPIEATYPADHWTKGVVVHIMENNSEMEQALASYACNADNFDAVVKYLLQNYDSRTSHSSIPTNAEIERRIASYLDGKRSGLAMYRKVH